MIDTSIELPELQIGDIEEHPYYAQLRLMQNVLHVSGYEIPLGEIAYLWQEFSYSLNVEWAPASEENIEILHKVLLQLMIES